LKWSMRLDGFFARWFGPKKRAHQIGALNFSGIQGKTRCIADVVLLHHSHDRWGEMLEKSLRYAFWDALDLTELATDEIVARYRDMWDETGLLLTDLDELLRRLNGSPSA